MIRLFGTTIRETGWALDTSVRLGKEKPAPTQSSPVAAPTQEDRSKAIARIVISLILLFAGIFFVGYNKGNSQTVGGTILGALAGYWLK